MSAHIKKCKRENNNRAYKICYLNHIRTITQICWVCPVNLSENPSNRKKRKPLKSWKYSKKAHKQYQKVKFKQNYQLFLDGKRRGH